MAKPLRQPTPSSAVARLFDMGAAARAIAAMNSPDPVSTPQVALVPTPAPSAQSANLKREFIFTQSAEDTFSELVSLYQRATGTKLTGSHVARAMLKGVAHCIVKGHEPLRGYWTRTVTSTTASLGPSEATTLPSL